jgi:ribonuclease Z
VRVSACYVEHIPREISPCFGLRMDTIDGPSIVFSGDTAPCNRLISLAQDCDLLIHECTFPQQAIDFRSKAGIGTWAHTSPHDLGKIAVAVRAKSLVATHFGQFDTTNPVLKKHLASTVERKFGTHFGLAAEPVQSSESGPGSMESRLSLVCTRNINCRRRN